MNVRETVQNKVLLSLLLQVIIQMWVLTRPL